MTKKVFTPVLIIIFIFIANLSFSQMIIDTAAGGKPNIHKVTVLEVLQANYYTYLRVQEKVGENWLAMPSIQSKPGDVYYYSGGLLMPQFESKDLNKKFDKIIFLTSVFKDSAMTTEAKSSAAAPHPMQGMSGEKADKTAMPAGKARLPKKNLKLDKATDGITIAELFSKKAEYGGKTVKIKAQVMKYNAGIMGRNWVHIQDGTEGDGNYDLMITTSATLHVGEVETFEGKIALNKDFGYGYSYDVIMEDAVKK